MSLSDVLVLIRKGWKILVIFPVLFALVTGVYCWTRMDNIYTASVSMYILSRNDNNQSSNVTSNELSISNALANDVAEIAISKKVRSSAAQQLGMASLAGYTISTSSGSTNRIMYVKVSGTSARGVAEVANGLASATAEIAAELMDLQGINIIDSASTPASPSGPNRPMYVGVAFIIGLCVAVGVIIFLDALDTTIKTRRDAEELFGLPVLGQMTLVKKAK